MTDPTQPPSRSRLARSAYPDRFANGGTYLLASAGDPVSTGVDLQILSEFGHPSDTAFVVTTTRSASTTVAELDALYEKSERPALGFVDTTSEHQSVSALFEGTPTIFTPAPGDLERLVLALSELTDRFPPGSSPRHLLIRSLTPILETTTTDRLCHVLERIQGLRTQTGLCLFGIDYTAHDTATMTAITQVIDGILWITDTNDGIAADYQQTRTPGSNPQPPGEEGDA